MQVQPKQKERVQPSPEVIQARHLAWLEITGQEARANRARQQQQRQQELQMRV